MELQLLILIAKAPTSTVFSVGNTTATNGTGTYVAYCFAEINTRSLASSLEIM